MRLFGGSKSFGGARKFRLYSALFVAAQAHSTTLSSPGLSEVVLRPGRERTQGEDAIFGGHQKAWFDSTEKWLPLTE